MTATRLDRMALDDVGLNSRRLAEAIHIQLGQISGPVPVHAIASALDIHEIREEPLSDIEAALVTTPERDVGSILVNAKSSPQRRRFSIGHELLHFLNPLHQQTTPGKFWCSRLDMMAVDQDQQDRHLRQEGEANSFAIELLAPRSRVRSFLKGRPDLKQVLGLAGDLDISREAAARRYVELHPELLAVVFCQSGQFIYASRHKEFPALSLRKGHPAPIAIDGTQGALPSIDEADPGEWLNKPPQGITFTSQTLYQQGGRSMTLLHAAVDDSFDEEETDRF